MASLDFKKLIKTIQKQLTPDLLNDKYKKQDHPLQGHCYVASEVFYHLLPNKKEWSPAYSTYVNIDGNYCSHWWIEHKITGQRIDVTATQFNKDFLNILYNNSHRSGFLTRTPSNRAKIVLKRLENE